MWDTPSHKSEPAIPRVTETNIIGAEHGGVCVIPTPKRWNRRIRFKVILRYFVNSNKRTVRGNNYQQAV